MIKLVRLKRSPVNHMECPGEKGADSRQQAGNPPGVGFSAHRQSTIKGRWELVLKGYKALLPLELHTVHMEGWTQAAKEKAENKDMGTVNPWTSPQGFCHYTSFWIFREEGQKKEPSGRTPFFLCCPSCILPTPANVGRANTHLW